MFYEQKGVMLDVEGVYEFGFKNDLSASEPRPYCMLSLRTEAEEATEIIAGDVSFSLKAGDLIFIPPETPYTRRSKNERLVVFHFYAPALNNEKMTVLPSISSAAADLFAEGLRVALAQPKGAGLKLNSVLYSILFELNTPPYGSEIKKAVDIITDGYCKEGFRISEVAKQIHISESNLRKKFKEETGLSPKQYCDNLRFERAASLLKSGHCSVEAAAEAVGFSSAKNFSSAFKKRYKLPPSCISNG